MGLALRQVAMEWGGALPARPMTGPIRQVHTSVKGRACIPACLGEVYFLPHRPAPIMTTQYPEVGAVPWYHILTRCLGVFHCATYPQITVGAATCHP